MVELQCTSIQHQFNTRLTLHILAYSRRYRCLFKIPYLITHSDETHPNSLCSLFRLYIYPNTTISAQILKSIPSTMVNQTSVTIAQAPSPLFFTQVSAGPGDSKLQFRLIHFWEARKHAKGGILIGIEMLMIDEQVYVTVSSFFLSTFSDYLFHH